MRIIRLLILMVMMSGAVVAQNSNNPWLISGGINGVSLQNDFADPLNDGTTYTKSDIKGFNIGVPSLSVFRSIVGGLSVGTQFSLNSLKKETSSGAIDFMNIDAALKYGFNRDGSISPYLKGGWGFSSFSAQDADKIDLSRQLTNTYFGTLGLDASLGDRWGIFLEASYRSTQDRPEVDYLLITAGVSVGLGAGDADKDGVNDKKDKCPDVPGLKEFEGCPDTDEDGIPDPEDDCPEAAGPEENKGCPDTDGDGVLDKDDSCPEEAGSAELNGCPDNDGDGVANPEDECPDEAGPAENKGCPWPDTDNDGVADKDDECPDTAGNTETGCPELTNEVMFTINQVGSNILFPASSSKIIGSKTIEALKEVKSILDANTEGKLIIEGHASSDGSEAYNLKLSQDRAESVLKKLIELGADPARLETKAFGESKPLIGKENDRAQNRRVEFHKRQ